MVVQINNNKTTVHFFFRSAHLLLIQCKNSRQKKSIAIPTAPKRDQKFCNLHMYEIEGQDIFEFEIPEERSSLQHCLRKKTS